MEKPNVQEVGCKTRSRAAGTRSGREKEKTNVEIKNSQNRIGDELNKVQWTKEFMEKMRRSNERHKKEIGKRKADAIDTNVDLFQNVDANLRGDGIVTEAEVISEEELDYDDDLSVDDGVDLLPPDQMVIEDISDREPQPRRCGDTSQIKHEVDNGLSTSTAGNDSSAQQWIANLGKQSEEQIYNNPIMQRMMQKFFNEQFKNVQMDNSGKGKGKLLNNEMKSPSDTTIYVPAMQKRLTPNAMNDQLQQNVGVRHIEAAMGEGIYSEIPMSDLNPRSAVMQQQQKVHQGHVDDINTISNFIETIRWENHPEEEVTRRKSDVIATELERAQKKVERTIIEAEKFRASVEAPGREIVAIPNRDMLNAGSSPEMVLNQNQDRISRFWTLVAV